MNNQNKSTYHRYHIKTKPTPDLIPWPNKFIVKVNKPQLAIHLIKDIFHHRGDMKTVISRPCIYGVFSGPIGGFAPRPEHCVGCLRCTTEYPQITQISHNPERQKLGDSYFNYKYVNTISYEASTGSIPVKGAGYRGKFGGDGWDGMWTDMSEIVRPTRDGIHGREFISTVVDIGTIPPYLSFDEKGKLAKFESKIFSISIPLMFDVPPSSAESAPLYNLLTKAAQETETIVVIPIEQIIQMNLKERQIIPLVKPQQLSLLEKINFIPLMIELDGWDKDAFNALQSTFPKTILALRIPFEESDQLLGYYNAGVHTFHLVADFHGHTSNSEFVMDAIHRVHLAFVKENIRDQVTLIGSGGIIAAEHVPKAIIMGLDLVSLDTPILVALQAQFMGECADRNRSIFHLPENLPIAWGTQRILNMIGTWHDQLLEILGAMGLREVRRLRGEIGRAMLQVDLEKEAFAGIDGYE